MWEDAKRYGVFMWLRSQDAVVRVTSGETAVALIHRSVHSVLCAIQSLATSFSPANEIPPNARSFTSLWARRRLCRVFGGKQQVIKSNKQCFVF